MGLESRNESRVEKEENARKSPCRKRAHSLEEFWRDFLLVMTLGWGTAAGVKMKKQFSFPRRSGPLKVHNKGFEYASSPFKIEHMPSPEWSFRFEKVAIPEPSFKQKMMDRLQDAKSFIRGLARGRWSASGQVKREAKVLILDPGSKGYQIWNRIFLVTCLLGIFLDPLFFYVPLLNKEDICFELHRELSITVTVLRTLIDSLYVIHMFLQFRTAFIAPSSRVFGRGELVRDPKEIARRYLRLHFWLDLVVILPLPQVAVWIVMPLLKTSSVKTASVKNAVLLLVVFHYVPRLFRMFFIVKNSELVRSENTGVFMETVWAGAAYNLILYMLASHVLGACWYILTIERQDVCFRRFCGKDPNEVNAGCRMRFFNCRSLHNDDFEESRANWFNATQILSNCAVADSGDPTSTPFNFGLYSAGIENNITVGKNFQRKYFYCLWFGLNGLSSLGQGFKVSTYAWEVLFAIVIVISGFLLFALLIGNVQKYLSSVGRRSDEMRLKRRDAEEWMNHRDLPLGLRNRVRRYDQYKWFETQGVDEQGLMNNLPQDLRRDIKRHLCLNLVKRVHLFNKMDDQLLDAICERLQPVLHIENSCIVREGDPVVEMVFIIRGQVESMTTNGGRTGFMNSDTLGPGDFCGEELLPWALDPSPDNSLPSSTRTVKAQTEVEAFSLSCKDLKFMGKQFSRKLGSKQLQSTFRYHSHQWRMWAATFIQITWRQYLKKKEGERLACEGLDGFTQQELDQLRAYDEAFMRTQEAIPSRQESTFERWNGSFRGLAVV
ncbi:hypothetical protein R1flu_013457 [Riccia fluitans]|uniref:Cyclic nucleotide-binding domain-containing protein n=1 Tax=Riccia fluitans TaxID=41844 RepID=A0ABD1YDF0_9MARC